MSTTNKTLTQFWFSIRTIFVAWKTDCFSSPVSQSFRVRWWRKALERCFLQIFFMSRLWGVTFVVSAFCKKPQKSQILAVTRSYSMSMWCLFICILHSHYFWPAPFLWIDSKYVCNHRESGKCVFLDKNFMSKIKLTFKSRIPKIQTSQNIP